MYLCATHLCNQALAWYYLIIRGKRQCGTCTYTSLGSLNRILSGLSMQPRYLLRYGIYQNMCVYLLATCRYM